MMKTTLCIRGIEPLWIVGEMLWCAKIWLFPILIYNEIFMQTGSNSPTISTNSLPFTLLVFLK